MEFKRDPKRSRFVKLTIDNQYETFSGAKFPIANKPISFGGLAEQFNQSFMDVVNIENERTEGKADFDMKFYTEVIQDYLDLFYEIVETVTNFNGFIIDKEYIMANMSNEDPYFYVQSVQFGYPVYTAEDMDLKKKR